MALGLALLFVAALQAEAGEGLPSWAYALSLNGTETASSEGELPRSLQAEPSGRGRDLGDLTLNVGLTGRYSIPFGAADRSTIVYGNNFFVVDHHVSWGDFFHPGWGVALELDIFFGKNGPGGNRNPGMNYGVVLLLQTDEYGGNHVNDSLGGSLSLDTMTMNSMMVGGKLIQTLGQSFYADGHFGIGAVHYSAVDGTFTGPFVQFRDEILKDTWTIASEFRGHVGVRLGPFGIVAGLGFRIQAPPHEGTRISMNSGAFWTFDLELGAELGF